MRLRLALSVVLGLPLILCGIVEESGNGHLLVRTMLKNQCGNRQQVGGVRDIGAFANLVGMEPGCKFQGLVKSGSE